MTAARAHPAGRLTLVRGIAQEVMWSAYAERAEHGYRSPDPCGPAGRHWTPRQPKPTIKLTMPPGQRLNEADAPPPVFLPWLKRLFQRQPKAPIHYVRPQVFERIARWQDEADQKHP